METDGVGMSADLVMEQVILSCVRRDPRYTQEAYHHVRQALDYTMREASPSGSVRHVSGQELLEGFRKFTLETYGQMSLRVLKNWGLARTEDVGAVVFNLVEAGALGKTEKDRPEDFSDIFEFDAAFAAPFRPRAPSRPRRRQRSSSDPRKGKSNP